MHTEYSGQYCYGVPPYAPPSMSVSCSRLYTNLPKDSIAVLGTDNYTTMQVVFLYVYTYIYACFVKFRLCGVLRHARFCTSTPYMALT